MLRDNNNLVKTFLVAAVLCLVCSFVVAAAAVGLRDRIRANKERYRMSNVLSVAGFTANDIQQAGGVEKAFAASFEQRYIKLDTGEEAAQELADLMSVSVDELSFRFEPLKHTKMSPATGLSKAFERSSDNIAGLIGHRENFALVYLKKSADGEVESYIFPIRGAGLWSTLYGFIALEPDLETVKGITFYEHGETPGLGGEVENPDWKANWHGKRVYAAGMAATQPDAVAIRVVKGEALADDAFGINGLAGATITSNGVTYLVQFWLGPQGFGPFIERERAARGAANGSTNETGGGS